MGAIQVKNVPPDIHESLRRRAGEEGMTIGEYILRLIRHDLELPSQQEWLRRLDERTPVNDVDVRAALEAVRAERDGS